MGIERCVKRYRRLAGSACRERPGSVRTAPCDRIGTVAIPCHDAVVDAHGGLVDAGDVDLHVLDTGGDGPALVLLHGLAGYAAEWTATVDAFAAGHRVVAFDQRGHGRSTTRPADVSREAYVRDVAVVADRLGLTDLTLVGQSMGAHTALLTAAEHGDLVRRLVLVEGGVGGGGRSVTEQVAGLLRGWPLPFADRESAAAWFGGGPVGRTWAKGLRHDADGLRPRFDVEVLLRAVDAVHAEASWDAWRGVSAPTLLVRGSAGSLAPAETDRMLAENGHARLVTVDGAGHDVHLEAADAFHEHLRTFLAG